MGRKTENQVRIGCNEIVPFSLILFFQSIFHHEREKQKQNKVKQSTLKLTLTQEGLAGRGMFGWACGKA
jgi:hypothetical protein